VIATSRRAFTSAPACGARPGPAQHADHLRFGLLDPRAGGGLFVFIALSRGVGPHPRQLRLGAADVVLSLAPARLGLPQQRLDLPPHRFGHFEIAFHGVDGRSRRGRGLGRDVLTARRGWHRCGRDRPRVRLGRRGRQARGGQGQDQEHSHEERSEQRPR